MARIGVDWSVPITVSGGIQDGTTRGTSWAGMEWPRSMDARQIAADWELALVMDAEYRDRQWIARNLGDVPMRIIDRDSVPVESLGRES